MKISRKQLKRIIREAITTVSDEDFDRITMPGYKGPQPPIDALAAAQEMGYQLNQPPELDSNNSAIDDALAAYPGEFTYEDIIFAIDAAGGVI